MSITALLAFEVENRAAQAFSFTRDSGTLGLGVGPPAGKIKWQKRLRENADV